MTNSRPHKHSGLSESMGVMEALSTKSSRHFIVCARESVAISTASTFREKNHDVAALSFKL